MTGAIDNNQERIVKEAIREFADARLRGEQPEIDEFVKRYPDLDHQVREGIQNLQKINALFDTLVRVDESDFEDPAAGQNLSGRKIGSFEIVELIGRGGMGVVYLARDTRLDRSVAIKSMPAELQSGSTAQARLQREARLSASLNHPNIAVIHEIIEQEEGTSYLVLEYVPGQTLAQRIAHKPLNLKETLSIAQQVVEAISAAHDKGVIHRDLKPGNIKITPEGKVKVLDFGLAKASSTQGQSIETTVTQPGRVIGTPTYMSPEQARGRSTDHRTDIWSFGCIMYEMLTGHVPFEGETATDTVARILEREPDWQALPGEIPANIRTLLRRCLEKDPRRRLGEIADAGVQISEVLTRPITSRPVKIPLTLSRMATIIGAAIIVLTVGVAIWLNHGKEAIRLVVLPFEDREVVEDESSTDIITAAIANRLVGISGLSIISRRSAMKYKNKEVGVRQIAEELRADYILEGAVQRGRLSDPNNQRRQIGIQLVRASDDTQIWADAYPMDSNGLFEVESAVAGHVVQALDITLPEPERRILESRPTENTAAYVYYLRGNYYHDRSFYRSDWEIAIQMYENAIELDPEFALAYAWRSVVHSHMYWHALDRSNERLVRAEQDARQALKLNPDLPEAHIALGFYHYWGHHDYRDALEEFAIAQRSKPDDSELLFSIGLVQRRLGKLDQTLDNFKRALKLDPISHIKALEIGYTLLLLRRYSQAERYYDLAISLKPDWPTAYDYKVTLYLCWHGNTQQARAVVQEAVKSTGRTFSLTLAKLDVHDGKYEEALNRFSPKSKGIDNQHDFRPLALRYAIIHGYMKEQEQAKKYYNEAQVILEAKIAENPEDERFHSALGIAYAGLGEEKKAIEHGKRATELMSASKDAVRGPSRHEDLALIYVMLDKYDDAINGLEYLLRIPGKLSIPLLKNDPAWAPLRELPHFRQLLESDK
jgi:non-specific serine/threonine protein kinase